MISLKDRKVIVTGGTKGIGKALTLALIKQGAVVGIVSRNSDRSLIDLGAQFYAQDLGELDRVTSAIANLVNQLGGVDILVNCAGMGYIKNLSDMPLADFQKVLDLNLLSVWQACLGVLPKMRSQKSGKIINVASIAAKQAFPGWGAYSASKFALLGMTQALAAEERSHGIQVMSICPGSVDTPLWDTLDPEVSAQFDRKSMLEPETVADAIISMLQLPASAIISDLVLMPNAGVL
jgi:NAD(P)-dependent dehydrogenase (short-subunit alcohol dehydrogenase family)